MRGYSRGGILGIAAVFLLANVLAQEPIGSDYASADAMQSIQDLQGESAEGEILTEPQSWKQIETNNGGTQYLDPQTANWQSHTTRFGQAGSAVANPESQAAFMSSVAPYVNSSPTAGEAPLMVTLEVRGMEQIPFWRWELDANGDGIKDAEGQGHPYLQITFDQPGVYAPSFAFFDNYNRIVAQATGSVTATAPGTSASYASHSAIQSGAAIIDGVPAGKQVLPSGWEGNPASGGGIVGSPNGGAGVQSQSQTLYPGGWGILGSDPKSGPGNPRDPEIPRTDLGAGAWSPPSEEFSDELDPELTVEPGRGIAPLTVTADASRTLSLHGIRQYNFDIAWGPNDAQDDGYYLYQGREPRWTYTIQEGGAYLIILDVEDSRGKKARTTKVIFVQDSQDSGF